MWLSGFTPAEGVKEGGLGRRKREKPGCGPVPAKPSAHPRGAVSRASLLETSQTAESVLPFILL